jgi:hypothetical protein
MRTAQLAYKMHVYSTATLTYMPTLMTLSDLFLFSFERQVTLTKRCNFF